MNEQGLGLATRAGLLGDGFVSTHSAASAAPAGRNGSVPPPVTAPHFFMNAEGPVSTVGVRQESWSAGAGTEVHGTPL